MQIEDLIPANPDLYMEFPDGSGASMEQMFGVSEARASEIADSIRSIIEKMNPGWDDRHDFIPNMPLYVQAASITCKTVKELSFFMMKLGGFTAEQGLMYQDPEEVSKKTQEIRNRHRSDVN